MVLLLLFVSITAALGAQSLSLSGTVTDLSNGKPLPFATVALLSTDSAVVTGAVTDEAGAFRLSPPARGRYLLSVSFIGYQTSFQSLDIDRQQTLLPTISLSPDATMLQAVQVVDRAPIVEQQMDKLVLNLSKTAFAQGSNALDLLRKAPGVSIDKDGNVLLNGQPVSRCGGFAIRRNRVSGFVIRLRQDVDVAVGVTMVNGIWPWALVYSAARM